MKNKLTLKTSIFTLALFLALPLTASAGEEWWGGGYGWQRTTQDMGADGPDPALQGVTSEIYKEMKDNPNYPPMEREANGTVLMEPMSGEYYTPYSTTTTTIMSGEADPVSSVTYRIDPQTEKLMREKRADGTVIYESVTTYEAAPAPMSGMSDGTILYEQTTDTIYLYKDDSASATGLPIKYTNEYEIYRGPETSGTLRSADGVLYEQTSGTTYMYKDNTGMSSNRGALQYRNHQRRGTETLQKWGDSEILPNDRSGLPFTHELRY